MKSLYITLGHEDVSDNIVSYGKLRCNANVFVCVNYDISEC